MFAFVAAADTGHVRQRGGHLGRDDTGADRVDPDAVGAQLIGCRADQLVHPGLGRAVRGQVAGRNDRAGAADRGERAAAVPAQHRHRVLESDEHAGQVGVR
jgi:hypothetical protein